MADLPSKTSKDTPSAPVRAGLPIWLGLFTVVLFFLASGFVSYSNTRILRQDAQLVAQTHDLISGLDSLISLVKDAETGQRGYLLTGKPDYLQPYTTALTLIHRRVDALKGLMQYDASQRLHIPAIESFVSEKLQELDEAIDAFDAGGAEAARAVLQTGRGKRAMDALRDEIETLRLQSTELRITRMAEMKDAYRIAIISGVLAAALGIILSVCIAYLLHLGVLARQRQAWIETGKAAFGDAILGELRMAQLGDNVLRFLAEYFGAHGGAFYVKENAVYRRVATYGVPQDGETPEQFATGESLLGQAAKDNRSFLIHDVPDGYMTVGSALGAARPRHLMISPAAADGIVNSVFELGFLNDIPEAAQELLGQIADAIGIAVKSANYRAHLQNLLEETQRQAEELQAQGEELRVSNEELEEQSRALKESQSRLEQQQAELEQTNAQLEEQTQLLEAQRDDLSRSKAMVQAKAQELEQASRYKSDFLANMSHELRTPLNSSLILAKLLADNQDGNLTDEQVKFAQTIQASGNALLTLINDILDLSKIEAGHMDIQIEPLTLARFVQDIARTVEPLAAQKGLSFKTTLAETAPDEVETDRHRLEQILRNLLANAIKFTETGSVELSIARGSKKTINIAVTDTGIGIAKDQQDAIFEAFRQADGTISRKYGGTGLGLSISRELARLLGGVITLKSTQGKGSTFTLTIPQHYDPAQVETGTGGLPDAAAESTMPPAKTAPKPQPLDAPQVQRVRRVPDDREKLSSKGRVILVVEDDDSFARILYDLVHELDFECIIAATAEEALIAARQYMPSAIVLDVGLPDNSGLTVLDRLKGDARMRHIPVHVISAGDYAQTALSLGAIGYMGKPVKREELVDALKKLETKFAQRMHRVLVVEDDQIQRDSVMTLLGANDVQTIGVGTAAECLAQLKQSNFDCMVLDLSLPDASGYALLETLSKEDAYSFPPVIVYTGRDLSVDEEQSLRRYSKSIIIKGAKSPERLLDEVTLFLHQVVADLPVERQKMLERARGRDAALEGRRILVVEDDVANIYALTSILEPRGAEIQIARNGREAIEALQAAQNDNAKAIDLVLMDVMMPEVDGITATKQIRQNKDWKTLPIIMLTAKAMRDDQQRCLDAGANDYMAKPLDIEKLLSLVRVWMPR